jgi:hypothetical protein
MKKIAEMTFAAELISEGSWGHRDLGKHESTMTLYETENRNHYFIEWDIPALETSEEIGLTFEHKRLVDYDGIFSLPSEAVKLIRKAGLTVPRDMQ